MSEKGRYQYWYEYSWSTEATKLYYYQPLYLLIVALY